MSKIDEIREAANEYGDTTIEWDDLCHKIASDIIAGFRQFLDPDADLVLPVTPFGDWRIADYQDQAFSNFGQLLNLEPVWFGMAVRVDHVKDDGHFWLRVALKMVRGENFVDIEAGEQRPTRLPFPYSQTDLAPVYDTLMSDILSIFERQGLSRANSIGFDLQPRMART